MTKRTSKEYAINTNTTFKSVLGTTNKHEPKILYVRSKAKVYPNISKKDYSDDIKSIKKDFNSYVLKTIRTCKNFEKNFIVNFDFGDNCLSYKKKSNLKYDVYLKPYVIKEIESQEKEVSVIMESLNKKLIELFNNKNITIN